MDPIRGVLMVIVVVFLMLVNLVAIKVLKRSYKACSHTVRIWVKQGFKVSNKMMSTLVTLTPFKFMLFLSQGLW